MSLKEKKENDNNSNNSNVIQINLNTVCKKHEALLYAKNNLSELGLKVLDLLYSSISQNDLQADKRYDFQAKDIIRALSYNKNQKDNSKKISGKMYKLIKEAMTDIFTHPIILSNDRTEKFTIFNWFSDADYDKGILSISFSQKIIPYIKDLKSNYVSYNINNILGLKGKYIIKLYNILKDRLEIAKRYDRPLDFELSVDELRKILNLPASYAYGSGIKLRILKKAQKQFMEYTDISFEIKEIKTGKKVTRLKFIFKDNISKNYTEKSEKNQENIQQKQKKLKKSSINKQNQVNNKKNENKSDKKADKNKQQKQNNKQNDSNANISLMQKRIKYFMDFIKYFYKKNNLTLQSNKIFLFERALMSLLKDYDVKVINETFKFAMKHPYHKKQLTNPRFLRDNFEAMKLSADEAKIKEQEKNESEPSAGL